MNGAKTAQCHAALDKMDQERGASALSMRLCERLREQRCADVQRCPGYSFDYNLYDECYDFDLDSGTAVLRQRLAEAPK